VFGGGFGHLLDEDGAGVAEPDAVGGPVMEVEAGEVGSGAAEEVGGAALGGEIVDEDVHILHSRQVADDLAVDPGDRLEFAGPVFGVVGPGDPGGGVWGPLGGHAVGRRLVGRSAHLAAPSWEGTPLPRSKSVQSLPFTRFRGGLPRRSRQSNSPGSRLDELASASVACLRKEPADLSIAVWR